MNTDTAPQSTESVGIPKPKFSFKSWYEGNKEKLSEIRKQRYQTDPEYRAKLKEQAKTYRANKPKVPRKKSTKMTIPMLCDAAECSVHTYRKYCQQKWIPISDEKFLFTEKHVQLLKALCAAARDSKYLRTSRQEHLEPFIKALQAGWN